MTPNLYQRQFDILHPRELEMSAVTLIGAGGIGSPVALGLAKMGIQHLTVYDPDTIEEHNLPNQIYPHSIFGTGLEMSTIGVPKTEALSDVIFMFSRLEIEERAKYEEQPLVGIVISAVDSMATRRQIWESVKRDAGRIRLYIDARMGAELGVVLTVNPSDESVCWWYERFMLYSDEDSAQLPCTGRAIIYNTMMIASLVCRQVKEHLKGHWLPNEIIFDMEHMVLMATQPITEEMEDTNGSKMEQGIAQSLARGTSD